MKFRVLFFLSAFTFLTFNAFAYTNNAEFGTDYHSGSPRFTDTCMTCHKLGYATDIFNLDSGGMTATQSAWMYEPGQTYTITVTMNEVNTGNTSVYYQNGFVLEILNSSNEPAGVLTAGTMTQLSSSPAGLVLDADSGASGAVVKQWSFNWTAPAAGLGPLKLWFAGVDGNGDGDADGTTGEDITDAGSLTLIEETVAPTPSGGCGLSSSLNESRVSSLTTGAIALLFLSGLIAFVLTRRRTDD